MQARPNPNGGRTPIGQAPLPRELTGVAPAEPGVDRQACKVASPRKRLLCPVTKTPPVTPGHSPGPRVRQALQAHDAAATPPRTIGSDSDAKGESRKCMRSKPAPNSAQCPPMPRGGNEATKPKKTKAVRGSQSPPMPRRGNEAAKPKKTKAVRGSHACTSRGREYGPCPIAPEPREGLPILQTGGTATTQFAL